MHISYLAPVAGVLNVWVGPEDDLAAARPVTDDARRGIRNHSWAFTNDHIIYLQDREGNENWRVYCVSLTSGKVRDLTPYEGVQARLQEVSHRHPTDVLVGLNRRDPQFHDLYRISIETGATQLVYRNEAFTKILADDDYRPRVGVRFGSGGGKVIVRLDADGRQETLLTIGPDDALSTTALGLDATGTVLYLIDSRDRETAALTTVSLETRATAAVGADRLADVDDVLIHPTHKTLQAYETNYQRRQWHPLTDQVAEDLRVLGGIARGDPKIVSRTLDDSTWLVTYIVGRTPARTYHYDRRTGIARFLFTTRPGLVGYPLVEMHPVVITARDGLQLVSYLTLPSGESWNGQTRTGGRPPLVLWVHGGPWQRDSWGYDATHQWLANRGYAVLSVNYRGSAGFGKAFLNAGNHEWGGKMEDDLLDSVRWAVEAGIADPKRIAIAGGSYGGYAAVMGLALQPDVFACGVDLVGPTNLVTFMEHLPQYWVPYLPLLQDRVGDPTTEAGREFLLSRSPIGQVDQISRPLLIGQGANDPRSPREQSDAMVKALQQRHIPVVYLLYPDEGHGLARPENAISFWAITEAFLARHLRGRCESIRGALDGSTLQVLAGADQIPGLAEALASRPSND